jgi:hypothetical protein
MEDTSMVETASWLSIIYLSKEQPGPVTVTESIFNLFPVKKNQLSVPLSPNPPTGVVPTQ